MSDTRSESRKAFEQWYATHAFDYVSNPIGSRECGLKWAAWEAAQTSEHRYPAQISAPAAPAHDREADRQRFPDPDFNRWLDESVSDYHIVWEAVGDIAAAWAGWDNRQYYVEPTAPAGYKLVPIEPTQSMVIDGFERTFEFEQTEEYDEMSGCEGAAQSARVCYAAMLAAAPETWKVLPSPVPVVKPSNDLLTALQQAAATLQQFKRDWMRVPYFADRVNKATREAISMALSPIVNLDAVGGPLDLAKHTATAPTGELKQAAVSPNTNHNEGTAS